MNYSLSDLQALAAATGFPDPALAAAVAMAESGGNPCSQGDPNIGVHRCDAPNGASTSFGLWQVNTPNNPQYDPKSLLDPRYNARAALEISRNGTTWRPWSTFKNGMYLRWYQNTVPQQAVTAPSNRSPGVVAAVALAAVVAATGFGAYKLLSRLTPAEQPEPDLPPPAFRRNFP